MKNYVLSELAHRKQYTHQNTCTSAHKKAIKFNTYNGLENLGTSHNG